MTFNYGEHGKPQLAELAATESLQFNVSHSAEVAVYVFARSYRVGIDVEVIRPLNNIEQLVKICFSEDEQNTFYTLPIDCRETAFFQAWTSKEAYVKATGKGLAQPLEQIEVSIFPHQPARLIRVNGSCQKISNWFLQVLPLPISLSRKPAIATVAIEALDWRLKLWTIQSYTF